VSELKYPEWQKPYRDALLETEKKKLESKIHLAEWKIFQRLQMFPPIATTMGKEQRFPMH
jgi:hypothetical protein